jgi:hypothetical protein
MSLLHQSLSAEGFLLIVVLLLWPTSNKRERMMFH